MVSFIYQIKIICNKKRYPKKSRFFVASLYKMFSDEILLHSQIPREMLRQLHRVIFQVLLQYLQVPVLNLQLFHIMQMYSYQLLLIYWLIV